MTHSQVRLGDVIKLEYGKSLEDSLRCDDGIFFAYGANGVKARTNKYLFDKPSIIVGRKGSAGELVLVRDKFWALDVTFYVTHDTSNTDLTYLYYVLQSKNLKSLAKGVKPGINRNDIYDLKIWLPPIATQQRIVEKLDAIFAEIDKASAAAEDNIKNAEALFQSYLTEVFEQGGEGWVEKPLKEISKVINGFAFKSQDFILNGGVKVIKISNVGVGSFLMNDEEFLPESYAEQYSSFAVHADSIVIPLTRTIINGGLKVAIVPDEYSGALLNQRVAAIVANEKIIDSNLIYYYLSSKVVKNYVLSNVNALMQPNLSIKDLLLLPVPIPSINEQRLILEKLEHMKRLTNDIKLFSISKINELGKLRTAILQNAFNGELIKE